MEMTLKMTGLANVLQDYKKVLEFTAVLRLPTALQFAYQIVRLVKKPVIIFLQVAKIV